MTTKRTKWETRMPGFTYRKIKRGMQLWPHNWRDHRHFLQARAGRWSVHRYLEDNPAGCYGSSEQVAGPFAGWDVAHACLITIIGK